MFQKNKMELYPPSWAPRESFEVDSLFEKYLVLECWNEICDSDGKIENP